MVLFESGNTSVKSYKLPSVPYFQIKTWDTGPESATIYLDTALSSLNFRVLICELDAQWLKQGRNAWFSHAEKSDGQSRTSMPPLPLGHQRPSTFQHPVPWGRTHILRAKLVLSPLLSFLGYKVFQGKGASLLVKEPSQKPYRALLLIAYWLGSTHMTVPSCKGGWDM